MIRREGLGQKYVNEPELWKQTEEMVRKVLIGSEIAYVEVPNEAAFYGPKIDVQVWSAIGREFTLATNQVDFAVPTKFGLVYRDRDNSEKTPLCIHRAPLGTHERFIGFLIEHYAGNFPLWLAPEQVRVLTHAARRKQLSRHGKLRERNRERTARKILSVANRISRRTKSTARIRKRKRRKSTRCSSSAAATWTPGAVSVRLHGKGNVGAKPKVEVVSEILAAIKERRGAHV